MADDAPSGAAPGRVRTTDGGPPRITAVVDLDDDQSEWVRHAAIQAGLSPTELIKRLIDEARVPQAKR